MPPSKPLHPPPRTKRIRRHALLFATPAAVLYPLPSYTHGSPWQDGVGVLRQAFTGRIGRGLNLVAIVIGGLVFALGERQFKQLIAGRVLRIGIAISAVNFMASPFP